MVVMFPIIPQVLSSSKLHIQPGVSLENSTFSTSLQLPKSVYESDILLEETISISASSDIPSGTSTSDLSLGDILVERLFLEKDAEYKKRNISISVDKNGYLSMDNEEDKSWIVHTKIADDCHSYNALLQFGNKTGTVKLCLTRTVKKNQQLTVWFTQDILAAMAVPFLTPMNIQGEKHYRCHICGKTFEYPNPLKIHLTLSCRITGKLELWLKLKDAITKNENTTITSRHITNNNTEAASFDSVLKSTKSCNKLPDKSVPLFQNKLNSPNFHCFKEENARPSSEPSSHNSAFKPYLNEKSNSTSSVQSPINLSHEILQPYFSTISLFSHGIPFIPSHNKVLLRSNEAMINAQDRNQQGSLVLQQAVDMETFVSNLGKSKQGHLCIYCGKIYSRKYGLKIHIRTHTGFKPLKCKFCLRPFGDPSNLNKHVRLHAEGETPYKCDLCGKVLVRRRDLERHMKSRHNSDCEVNETEEVPHIN